MTDDNEEKSADTKRCPQCKKLFTRQELKLSANQWFTRVYCSIKCSSKGKHNKLHYGRDDR